MHRDDVHDYVDLFPLVEGLNPVCHIINFPFSNKMNNLLKTCFGRLSFPTVMKCPLRILVF